jgi:hypothetical protein
LNGELLDFHLALVAWYDCSTRFAAPIFRMAIIFIFISISGEVPYCPNNEQSLPYQPHQFDATAGKIRNVPML